MKGGKGCLKRAMSWQAKGYDHFRRVIMRLSTKLGKKWKKSILRAKTKKMQDRILAAGHTFWLNQELGLKRVAAPLLLLAKLNFITFLSKIANWIERYAQISLLHLVPSHKLYFLLNLYWLFEKKYYSSKFMLVNLAQIYGYFQSTLGIFIPNYSSEEHLYLKHCMVLIGTGVLIFQIFALIGWVMSPNIRSTAEA